MASNGFDCLVRGLSFRQFGYARHPQVMKPDIDPCPLPSFFPCRTPSLRWASRVNLPIVPPREYVVGRFGIRVTPGPFDESFECGRVEWNYAASSKFVL